MKLGVGPKPLKLPGDGTIYAKEVTLMKLGAGPKVLKLINEGTLDAKELAASAICMLAVNDENKLTLMELGA